MGVNPSAVRALALTLVLSIVAVGCTPATSPVSSTAPGGERQPADAAASGVGAGSAGGTASVSCADAASQGPGGAPIKIGSSISLTGASANFGVNMRRGVEICLSELNAAGGYQGRPVEVIFLDDQAKPEVAVNNTTRFITQDKVVGMLGPVNSGNGLAFRPLVEEAEIPTIVPIATAVSLIYDGPVYEAGKSKPSPYMFRTSMQDNFQVETILAYAKQKGWDAIGLMHDTSGYGMASRDTAQALIPAGGFKILATATYNVGDTDMTSQLQRMEAAGVKQILNFGLGPENANLLRSAQKLDYKVQWAGPLGWSDPVLLELAGPALAEGVISVTSYTIDANPVAAEFHQKMLSEYQEDPFPITAAQGYDAAHAMFLALAKSGPNPRKLRDAIEQIDDLRSVTSAPSRPFGPGRHHSLEARDMFIATYKNGLLVKAD